MKVDKYFHLYGKGKELLFEEVPSAETQIIRCKDCKWFYKSNWCVRYLKPFMADDFCSYAERRTDE